ncbi:glycoside hydrolase family 3 C-terminal domain-containing protein [Streptomyces sp. SID13726]|uniref:glycoside hydrolase family 3 C-terminal domain-containing protein n=1 Tax=Streptomyces sp. SID13726 TaxID=2706058 RepID=UPI0013BA4082|nr:glycoside hydrolase family 3 C-terminal domain-containing protein [Streptomyces sp. SID13726]NEA98787.1 beta-glucosidase [Streptomyces sp. SID13726]
MPQISPNPRTDLAQLSLEQKAALLSSQDFWSTRPLEEPGLPSVVLTDGPHGVRRQVGEFDHMGIYESLPSTCFPPAVAVGSSWDPEVAARIGAAVGREARALGVHVVLGPGVNIKRSPLCGRNFEYYSEDPLLSGHLGAAHVRGQQEQGVGASLKHFAVNNQETDRMRVSADVDERTLREIYLPAFEHVVTEAAPATVMAAYNKVNGVHAAQHHRLLTEVLRGEWGFTGAVVSDWGAVHDPVASVRAGLDLEMPGPAPENTRRIVEAVRDGELDESVVDTAVRRVLGLTEYVVEQSTGFDADAHHRLARELATECAVLLQNDDGVLPLAPGQRIAVVGEFAVSPRYQAGGSSHLNPTRLDNALDAMRESAAGRGDSVEFAPGFALDGSGDAESLRADAVALARSSDVAVVFAGLAESEESEGFDRDTLRLPAVQVELIRAVAAVAARTVVVLSNGGVVSLEGWHDEVDAVLEGFLLGQGGGGAIADLLFGEANPSGRLAETIPLRLEDNPSFVNFPGEQGHVRYGEGVMVGYRWYGTTGTPVRHPFGHGLSYTTFTARDLSVRATGDDSAHVSVTVTNTGDRAGKHVVQIYVATEAGPVRRPARELRAFTKVRLEPGESRTVGFDLGRRAFAHYDVQDARWAVAPGDYLVQLGENAATVIDEVRVSLAGDAVAQELTLESTFGEWVEHPVVGSTVLRELAAALPEDQGSRIGDRPELLQAVRDVPMKRVVGLAEGNVLDETLERLMARTRAAE